jgi:hypothetical protein
MTALIKIENAPANMQKATGLAVDGRWGTCSTRLFLRLCWQGKLELVDHSRSIHAHEQPMRRFMVSPSFLNGGRRDPLGLIRSPITLFEETVFQGAASLCQPGDTHSVNRWTLLDEVALYAGDHQPGWGVLWVEGYVIRARKELSLVRRAHFVSPAGSERADPTGVPGALGWVLGEGSLGHGHYASALLQIFRSPRHSLRGWA